MTLDTFDEAYEERCALMEFDGGLRRAQAEAAVRACLGYPALVEAVVSGGVTLRPYQQDAVAAVLAALGRGEHPVVAMATGAGKSLCIAALCAQLPGRVLVATHRKRLLEQNSTQLARYLEIEEAIGVYSAGLEQRDTTQRVIFGGVQSIYKRMDELQQAGAFGTIIIDEVHLVPDCTNTASMYARVLTACPEAQRIGLSATPSRMGTPVYGSPDTWFTTCVYSAGIRDLTPQYLAPLVGVLTAQDVDLSQVRVRQGEFVAADASQAMSEETVARAASTEVCTLAQQRQAWVVFCCDLAHTHLVATLLREAGITCGVVTSDQPSADNDAAMAAFEDGTTRALVSCAMLTTGVDLPRIDCIVLLRPTMSKELRLQMIGRATRHAPGKRDALLLDYAGNLARHAPLDALSAVTKSPERTRQERAAETAHEEQEEQEEQEARARRARHAASVLALTRYTVDRLRLRVTPSKRQPGTWLLQVGYHCPQRQGGAWVTVWLCVEYLGWPRAQAVAWFQRRGARCPATAHQAQAVAERAPLPRAIVVQEERPWPRVVMEYFEDD